MKLSKKIAALILAVTMLVPFAGMNADAADGTLMFSDPETKVGENVSVTMLIQSPGGAIGDVDVTMSYDPTQLEFVNGNEVSSDGNGTLTYSHKGTGTESELRTEIEFRALKQGDANISVTGQTAYLYSDESLMLEEGSSVIRIDVGADGSTSLEPNSTSGSVEATDVKVTVNGEEYSFSEAFTESDIPDGFSETMLQYDGAERKFVTNESGVKLGFLVDEVGKANFFLYNEENATFSSFVEIYISETTSIILLDNVEGVSLPEQYQKADLQVGEKIFPAWQDMEHDGYYIIYAMNTATGQKELYQYDTVDGTYQRFVQTDTVNAKEPEQEHGIVGKVKEQVNRHFMVFLVVGGSVFLAFLIVVIVLAVKLYRRNSELDDLYDEYDIDELGEQEDYKKRNKKSIVSKQKNDYDDDYQDDDTMYDDFDDYNDDFYDDDFEVTFDEEEKQSSRKRNDKTKNAQKHQNYNESDPYDVDFIDL